MEKPDTSDSTSVVSVLKPMLEYAVQHSASDLHIAVGVPPTVRIDGGLGPIPGMPSVTRELADSLVGSMMTAEQRSTFQRDLEIDFTFGRAGLGRFRVNAFHEQGRVSASLRRIPDTAPDLDSLGLPRVVATLSQLRNGLVLVTGPTGSGKSTTLASMIDRINQERCERIITVEDPVEFLHRHKRSFVQQREIGRDTRSFARALKSVLREDPDVVLVGEMRDHETVAAAVSAAETGHLIFATLHTNSAAQTISRVIDVFPSDQQSQIRAQLSASLQAVVSQRLVPTLQGARVCVAEVLIATEAVRNIIREGKDHQIELAMQSGLKEGMVLFDTRLAELVRTRKIAMDVAVNYAHDPRGLRSRLGAD